jgi:hypothetical protein
MTDLLSRLRVANLGEVVEVVEVVEVLDFGVLAG